MVPQNLLSLMFSQYSLNECCTWMPTSMLLCSMAQLLLCGGAMDTRKRRNTSHLLKCLLHHNEQPSKSAKQDFLPPGLLTVISMEVRYAGCVSLDWNLHLILWASGIAHCSLLPAILVRCWVQTTDNEPTHPLYRYVLTGFVPFRHVSSSLDLILQLHIIQLKLCLMKFS